MRRLPGAFIALITLLYPLAVYFGIQRFEPWTLAVVLIALLSARLASAEAAGRSRRFLWPVLALYCAAAVWSNDAVTLRIYPVLMNLVMLSAFAGSLLFPPPLVERLARLRHPDLPPEGVLYTRRVTEVWCLFFIINGGIALYTAVWGSLELWSLYNGLIAYLLMGVLMAGEYLFRMKTQKHG